MSKLAAGAFILIEIHYAVFILNDSIRGRACGKAGRVFAMHTSVFSHEIFDISVYYGFVKIYHRPCRRSKRAVKLHASEVFGFIRGQVVPFLARHLASLAPGAS